MYPFQINTTEIIVKGIVVVMLADTQAAHSIGGFKVSVGFARQKCCDCLKIEEIMKYKLSTFKTTVVLCMENLYH